MDGREGGVPVPKLLDDCCVELQHLDADERANNAAEMNNGGGEEGNNRLTGRWGAGVSK